MGCEMMTVQEQLALLKRQATVTNDLIEQMKDAPEELICECGMGSTCDVCLNEHAEGSEAEVKDEVETVEDVMYDGTPHDNDKKFFMYDDPIAAWFGKVIHNVAKRI